MMRYTVKNGTDGVPTPWNGGGEDLFSILNLKLKQTKTQVSASLTTLKQKQYFFGAYRGNSLPVANRILV